MSLTYVTDASTTSILTVYLFLRIQILRKTFDIGSHCKQFNVKGLFCFILCYVMLCYVMLCYVMLCYVMLCYVMLCYFMLCYVMFCYVMLCYVMLCYVMLCYVMLTTEIPCYCAPV